MEAGPSSSHIRSMKNNRIGTAMDSFATAYHVEYSSYNEYAFCMGFKFNSME